MAFAEWVKDYEKDAVLAYEFCMGVDATEIEEHDFRDAYMGEHGDGAEFAKELVLSCYDLSVMPDFLRNHIDWQKVWDCELRFDYYEENGHFFLNC